MAERYRIKLRDEDIDIKDMPTRKRKKLAQNTKNPDILRELAKDEESLVRQEVALNKNTPIDILRKLADDGYYWVHRGVASNPNTPVDILRELAENEKIGIRMGVASNTSTPVDVLRKLANDEDPLVRMFTRGNPNTPDMNGEDNYNLNDSKFNKEKVKEDIKRRFTLYELDQYSIKTLTFAYLMDMRPEYCEGMDVEPEFTEEQLDEYDEVYAIIREILHSMFPNFRDSKQY